MNLRTIALRYFEETESNRDELEIPDRIRKSKTMAENPNQTLSPRLRQDLFERLSTKKDAIFWTGVAMTVAGVLALVFPVVTSLTVEILIGWVLVVAGVATVYGAFSVEGTGPFFGQLLLGFLKLALGIYLIMHPGVGMLALTLLLVAVFMVDGAVQFAFAFDLRPKDGWGWMLLSAIVSVAVGLLIAAGLPGTSLIALGILVGVNFLSTGIALIMLSSKLTAPAT
jgi:uncharacterized membrane protein HdeD (DUF308 family)